MEIRNNRMYIGKHSVSALAKEYKTPLMLFDRDKLIANMNVISKFNGQVVYASKAFLDPTIIKLCGKYNWGIDAVSLGDLYVIEKSGFDCSNIYFHGNNKSLDELKMALKLGVIIVVDNLGELETLCELTKNKSDIVKTFFRINPGIDAHTHYFIQTSLLSSKFGESIFDSVAIEKSISLYKANPQLKLLGFHSHIGSQIVDSTAFIKNAKVMLDMSKDVSENYGYELTSLNIGGGFGIRYTDEAVSLEEMITSLNNFIGDYQKQIGTNLLMLIEPGRSVVGDACTTVYKMSYLKETFGKKRYIFVDGGMTDNIRPALYQAKYTVVNPDMVVGETVLADVVGKCCESGDIVASDVNVVYQEGGYLVVLATGAYCYMMSSNYNNALRPLVLMVGDKIETMIRRQSLDDLWSLFGKEIND